MPCHVIEFIKVHIPRSDRWVCESLPLRDVAFHVSVCSPQVWERLYCKLWRQVSIGEIVLGGDGVVIIACGVGEWDSGTESALSFLSCSLWTACCPHVLRRKVSAPPYLTYFRLLLEHSHIWLPEDHWLSSIKVWCGFLSSLYNNLDPEPGETYTFLGLQHAVNALQSHRKYFLSFIDG